MLTNILLGVLGIVLYTLIKARPYLVSKEIPTDWDKFKLDNLRSWLWAFLILVVIAAILNYAPEANQIIGQALGGLDLTNSPIGFLGLGMFLSFNTKEAGK